MSALVRGDRRAAQQMLGADGEVEDAKVLAAFESRGRLYDYMVTGTEVPVPTQRTRDLVRSTASGAAYE